MTSRLVESYSPQGVPTMQRLTISIGAGDHVAIVGRSGAGESNYDLMTSDCDWMTSDCDLMTSDCDLMISDDRG